MGGGRLPGVARVVVLSLVVVLSAGCFARAELEQGPGIVGTYVVNGVDPVGTEYTGRVSITAASDPDTYLIEWVVTGAILEGTATLDGTTLSATWETVESPRGVSRGTAEYEVRDDGTLVGTRTIEGFDRVGTETIFPDP